MWSRRIDREHRLVYSVEEDTVTVYACRFHYGR
nr:type II toxin-antitoxin system YoeB family toxin [Neisseria weaveri]